MSRRTVWVVQVFEIAPAYDLKSPDRSLLVRLYWDETKARRFMVGSVAGLPGRRAEIWEEVVK